MRSSEEGLKGRTVVAADGASIGEVTSLFLDTADWHVESLQVRLHREVADQLGASRSMFHAGTLEVPTRAVQSVGDAVILTLDVKALRQLLTGASQGAKSTRGDDAQSTAHH